ncbi:MAG: hypothetical protein AB1762_17295, partial [Gemmatimonadota bacterium]
KGGTYRTATDLDILALRFPRAGRLTPALKRSPAADEEHADPDPALGVSAEQADMIVGEIKEGRAALNEAATDPGVIRAALAAFGCCSREEAPRVVETLLREGSARLPIGHRIRYVVFASTERSTGNYRSVSLRHVVDSLRAYITEHWEMLRHTDSKDPAFGFLMTLAKAERGTP